MQCALSRERARPERAGLAVGVGQSDRRIDLIRRLVAFPQGEMTVNFGGLYERARERGWTLSKSTEAARYGTMPIRYILKDHKGLMYFRNLDEVERRLNTKAKQS